MTEVEDDDDSLSLSIGDIFQDNFSSTQMDNENIEKLILKCENDMRDDNEDNMEDITEIEDKKPRWQKKNQRELAENGGDTEKEIP